MCLSFLQTMDITAAEKKALEEVCNVLYAEVPVNTTDMV